MAVRGIYNEAQQEMLARVNKRADELVGWVDPPDKFVATEDGIKSYGAVCDYWNPLWRDENYAKGTRWGSIIAFPMYQDRFGGGFFPPTMQATPECGYFQMRTIGDDWEFFKPVRPGDTFRVWSDRPQVEDITPLDGKGPLTFALTVTRNYHINQRDELVSKFTRMVQSSFYEKPLDPIQPIPDARYNYSKDELEYINKMIDAEVVRGANIRYWEDVKVGEEMAPVELGPTTVWDTVSYAAAGSISLQPRREELKRMNESGSWDFTQADTGVYHHPIETHFSDYVANLRGRPMAFLFMPLARNLTARLITNWMGDDGFLRELSFRYIAQTFIGDTLVGRGRVTNKKVENGEHLVDLEVWVENLRGDVQKATIATVSLVSKEASVYNQWK